MKAHWHKIDFRCKCGLEGTILEVCTSLDGHMSIYGLCAICGEEFTKDFSMAPLVAQDAIYDYVRCREEQPEDFLLEDFKPTGKPS
jgi:DNA-directed RNA polymerase subunit RPC12/RpoP